MGIKDLLRFLKPYTEAIHIEKYGGNEWESMRIHGFTKEVNSLFFLSELALSLKFQLGLGVLKAFGTETAFIVSTRQLIDFMVFILSAYSCSMEICLDSDSDAKFKYIRYFMHRINMLRHYNVVPVVVFDGGSVACKAATEDERYRRRQANRDMAMEKLKEGNVGAATELFQRAISITTSMAHQLIQTLRGENVEFMVAPYEADAQLAYLAILGEEKGGIEAVITEDSDLLAYGCSSVIFKMDRYGNGEEILLEKVFNSTNYKPSFQNFNRDLFTGMCVLAGCDFLPSIPGIGIGKAHSLVSKYYNIDRVLSILKFGKGNQMPENYLRSFKQAVAVFQHARVYDKITKRIQHIKPLGEELLHALDGELDFLGSNLPPSIATAISEGIMDPITMEAYNCSLNTRIHQPNPHFEKNTEPTMAATAGSCFAVYSSRKKDVTKISSKLISGTDKAEVPMQRQVLKERNCSNEAAQLAMIAEGKEFLNNSCKKSKQDFLFKENTSGNSVICTPNNNPFKRCNKDASEMPMVSDKTVMKTPFKTGDQVTSSMTMSMLCDEIAFKTPDSNPFKRRCDQITSADLLQEGDALAESCTTEAVVTDSNMGFSSVLDSQGSVNSKVSKMQDSRTGNKCRTRLKRSDCKSSGGSTRTRRSTILDFFSYS